MKTNIAILFFLISLSCFGQSNFKKYFPSMALTFASGLTDGARDGFMYRADNMGQFWNGKQSFNNKYKNGDINQGAAYFGSTTFLVFTTDAAHMSNMLTHQFTGMALCYVPYDENKKFWHVFAKVAAYNLIRQAGHSIVYSLIFHSNYKP